MLRQQMHQVSREKHGCTSRKTEQAMAQAPPPSVPDMLPPADGSIRHFTPGEEIANWVTHGIGLLLSTAAPRGTW